ncbi:hypothetical protein B1H10_02560 [candidate division KSB1 bacterium 4484_188]|nr:MAG: hypothetical protein B1H10_02560 [candidate division KSB1 bacterium 4484_188]HFE62892.1 hypothetical protein [Caldithrix sp.]
MTGPERKINLTIEVDEDLYNYYKSLGWTLSFDFRNKIRGTARHHWRKDLNVVLEEIFIEEIRLFITSQILNEAKRKFPGDIIEQFRLLIDQIKKNEAIQRLRFKIPDIQKLIWSEILERYESQGVNTTEILKLFKKEELEEIDF